MQHAPQAEHSMFWHPFAQSPAETGAHTPLGAYKAQTLALLNQERAALGALLHQLRHGRPPHQPL